MGCERDIRSLCVCSRPADGDASRAEGRSPLEWKRQSRGSRGVLASAEYLMPHCSISRLFVPLYPSFTNLVPLYLSVCFSEHLLFSSTYQYHGIAVLPCLWRVCLTACLGLSLSFI